MDEESIAHAIKKEILNKNFNRYFDALDKAGQDPLINESWHKAQLLYYSIDENNKDNLKTFIKMIMTETITEFLAYIDGIATFRDQEYPFELFYNKKKVSGSLQEYLLMDIEDNGSF